MRKLAISEGVVVAGLILMGFITGMAVQYAFGPDVKLSAGGGNELELNVSYGEAVAAGAIIAVGIGILGFLWTVSRDVSSLRERMARLEKQEKD